MALTAITQLATATQASPAVIDALVAALCSEHADLRLRAAVALVRHGNPQGIEVLGAFLRTEDHEDEAIKALVSVADRPESAAAAAEVIIRALQRPMDGAVLAGCEAAHGEGRSE